MCYVDASCPREYFRPEYRLVHPSDSERSYPMVLVWSPRLQALHSRTCVGHNVLWLGKTELWYNILRFVLYLFLSVCLVCIRLPSMLNTFSWSMKRHSTRGADKDGERVPDWSSATWLGQSARFSFFAPLLHDGNTTANNGPSACKGRPTLLSMWSVNVLCVLWTLLCCVFLQTIFFLLWNVVLCAKFTFPSLCFHSLFDKTNSETHYWKLILAVTQECRLCSQYATPCPDMCFTSHSCYPSSSVSVFSRLAAPVLVALGVSARYSPSWIGLMLKSTS